MSITNKKFKTYYVREYKTDEEDPQENHQVL